METKKGSRSVIILSYFFDYVNRGCCKSETCSSPGYVCTQIQRFLCSLHTKMKLSMCYKLYFMGGAVLMCSTSLSPVYPSFLYTSQTKTIYHGDFIAGYIPLFEKLSAYDSYDFISKDEAVYCSSGKVIEICLGRCVVGIEPYNRRGCAETVGFLSDSYGRSCITVENA